MAKVLEVHQGGAEPRDGGVAARDLLVRPLAPFARALDAGRGVPRRSVVVRREAAAGVFRPGGHVVLTPEESRAVGCRAAAAGDGRVRLASPYLEASLVPHLGGHVERLALRSSGFSPLDDRLVPSFTGGFEPGGIYDALGRWDLPLPTWAARYRVVRRADGRVALASGGTDEVRFRRRIDLAADAPLALIDLDARLRARRKAAAGGEEGSQEAPQVEIDVALSNRVDTEIVCLHPDGDEAQAFHANPEPPIGRANATGEVERLPGLAAGALAAVAGDAGATVFLADPRALSTAFVLQQRLRAVALVRFRPSLVGVGLAIGLAERVAVGPRGLAFAASAPAGPDRVRVSVVLRDLAARGRVLAEVAGREVVLAPRSLGRAGRCHAGTVEMAADEWRSGLLRIAAGEGEYVM